MKDLDLNKRLTGEFQVGLDENSQIRPNAEIEGGEYLKYPDGSTVKGYGEKHENGGIKVHLPEGTKVLSNNLTLGKSQSKSLSKEFDIKLTSGTTYSQALDEYVKKIGLKKLYKEEEELIDKMGKIVDQDDPIDENTRGLNRQYISDKIRDVELRKVEKEKIKADVFDKLFNIQENSKPKSKSDDQFFERGGITKGQFKDLLKKYNLTEKQGKHLVEHGELLPMFEDGGEYPEPKTRQDVDNLLKENKINNWDAAVYKAKIIMDEGGPSTISDVDILLETGNITNTQADEYRHGIDISEGGSGTGKIVFTTKTGRHTFSQESVFRREKQATGEGAFGKITKENIGNVIEELYKNFPDIVSKDDVFGAYRDDDGEFHYNKDLDFTKQLKQVKRFQEEANSRMKANADTILNNPNMFSPEDVERANNYKDTQTFDGSLARGLDSKLGQFTAGRFSLGVDIVTPEEKKDLEQRGITTVNQLEDAITKGTVKISDGSLKRLDTIKKTQVEGANLAINEFQPSDPKPAEDPPKIEDPVKSDPIVDDIKKPVAKGPKYFIEPNQVPLPPSPLQAHLKGEIRLQRVDPIRVGIENIKQQADEGLRFATQQLDGLPPNQRAAAIASMQAGYQKSINDAIHKANVTNATNQSRAELFNIGQADSEQKLNLANDLDFERRTFTAMAKTEEEFRNYFDELRRINVNSFRNQQELNLLNQRYENFDLNTFGNQVNYVQNSGTKVEDKPLGF